MSARRLSAPLAAARLPSRWLLRLAAPGARPMHHDEANQAVKFGELLETGDYRYDPDDHHGPTLYYLTLPGGVAARAGHAGVAGRGDPAGRHRPLRGGCSSCSCRSWRGLGRGAAAAAALFMARVASVDLLQPLLHPGIGLRLLRDRLPRRARAVRASGGRVAARRAVAGACSPGSRTPPRRRRIIVLAAAGGGGARLRWIARGGRLRGRAGSTLLAGIAAGRPGAAVAFMFYSSFFGHPGGLLESVRAFGTYLDRGVGPARTSSPSDYYLRLLAWSSSGGLVWTEGAGPRAGAGGARRRRPGARARFWPRYLAMYAVGGRSSSRRSPTRRRGTCCRSRPAAS